MAERFTNVSRLAMETGLSRMAIHQMMSGQTRNPNIDSLQKLAYCLEITITELMTVPTDDETSNSGAEKPHHDHGTDDGSDRR